jgi:hypothetical protein
MFDDPVKLWLHPAENCPSGVVGIVSELQAVLPQLKLGPSPFRAMPMPYLDLDHSGFFEKSADDQGAELARAIGRVIDIVALQSPSVPASGERSR